MTDRRRYVTVEPPLTPEDGAWVRLQAFLGELGVIRYRKGGGFTAEHPDGSYGYVCSRHDLAGGPW